MNPNPPPPPMPPMPPSAPPYAAPPAPYYNPPPPPAGKSPLFYAAIVAGCCGIPVLLLIVFAAVLFPVFAQAREKARETSCSNNVKRMGMAAIQYAQDYDEKYPPAKQWMDHLAVYTGGGGGSVSASGSARSLDYAFHCPSVSPRLAESDKFGYAYNSLLAGKSSVEMEAPGRIPMIYDSEDLQKNASDPFKSLAYRHLKNAVIGYADGHATLKKSSDAQ